MAERRKAEEASEETSYTDGQQAESSKERENQEECSEATSPVLEESNCVRNEYQRQSRPGVIEDSIGNLKKQIKILKTAEASHAITIQKPDTTRFRECHIYIYHKSRFEAIEHTD